MPNYVFYREDNEALAPNQPETDNKVIEIIAEAHPAETQGMLKGKLIVAESLPVELAQGAFAKPGSSDVFIRLAAAACECPGDSGNLTLSCPKPLHPMAAVYHSEAPVRYGDTIANIAIVPSSPGLLALKSHPFSPGTPNALREAIIAFFHSNPAEFDFRVQLITSALDSLYRSVARLIIPAQSFDAPVAGSLAFPPVHVQAPANRLPTYPAASSLRRRRSPGRLNPLPA